MSIFKNSKVLITGISGFVGGQIAKSLLDLGADVHGLVRDQKTNTFTSISGLNNRIDFIAGDLCNLQLLERIISERQIEYVFHLAAQVEVGVGLQNPYLTFESNIRGTYTLLEAVRRFNSSVKAVVVASSDKSYGEYPMDAMPYQEHYPLLAKYPYDTSKACADMVASAYANDVYGLPIVTTRFCNIYGPGQLNFSAIIPEAMRSLIEHYPFEPRSDGKMIRDFLFVEDVADLYIKIAEHLAKDPSKYRGQVYNAGPNDPVSMRDLLKTIFHQHNQHNEYELVLKKMMKKDTYGEISTQSMSHDKALLHFGWQPTTTLPDGLIKTYTWYEEYLKKNTNGA